MGDPILQPQRVGTLSLPNRVVMTTVKLGYATKDGEVTDRHVAFYRRRALAGVGLLTTEPLFIRPDGREIPTQMGIHRDELVRGLAGLAESVHEAGGRIMAHLNHAGRAANPKLVGDGGLVSASDVPCPANQGVARPLTRGEIREVVLAFGQASRRIRQAGFDAVEIPFSHGYLIHQFLSPHSNLREDEYGGDFRNRVRFGREVLDAVRGAVGPDFPVVVRMNAVDYVDGGLELEDALHLANTLGEGGVDALSVTSGTMCETVPFCLYPAGTPEAHLLPMAGRIREISGLPIIVAGRIRTPEVARRALESGQTDLIGLGRPFLADPDWVLKVRAEDEEGILLCAACHQGCLGTLRKGLGTGCLANPLTGRESRFDLKPADTPRKIVVVGGGPAGLKAAAVAASRGHQVSLFEEKDHMGGQLTLAARAPHKEGFQDVVRHLELMARRSGVAIHMSSHIDRDDLMAGKPDAVVLATGGIPLTALFPGLESVPWAMAGDIMEGKIPLEAESLLVIGGGLVGLEAADFISAREKKVVLVEMLQEVGAKLDPLPRVMLLKRLRAKGVEIHTATHVAKIEPGKVELEKEGEIFEVPAEMVVLAVGVRANRDLVEELEGSGLEIHTVGDALEPRGAGEAILEGLEAGAAV